MEVDKRNASTSNKSRLNESPDNAHVGIKIYSTALIIVDVVVLIVKLLLGILEALYRTVIPVELKSVQGEIVVVTGAGHGIGRELALQYAALGSVVVCWDINEKGNEDTVKNIRSAGGKGHAYHVDVTNHEQILSTAKKVQQEVGEVSIIVNNAGIMPTHKLLEHTHSEIRRIFDINVFAHFSMFEAFLPSMLKRNHGHVVALSSMAGLIGFANLVPYCGSKFAVRGIMEALAEELRTDFRINEIKFTTVMPYMVDTGLCKNPHIRFASLMKMVKPSECAAAIIQAQRRNVPETSIPSYLMGMNTFCRALPSKVGFLIKDFVDSGLESDLK